MYGLAGYIAEQLKDGTAWEDLVTTHILNPLGMTSTTFSRDIQDWDNMAAPYVLYEDNLVALQKDLIK